MPAILVRPTFVFAEELAYDGTLVPCRDMWGLAPDNEVCSVVCFIIRILISVFC